MTSLKIRYGSDVRRITLNGLPSYEELTRLVQHTYGKENGDYVIKYEDDELDLITVSSDEEVRQAALYAGRTSGMLRFEVFDMGNREKMRSSNMSMTDVQPMNMSALLLNPSLSSSSSNPLPLNTSQTLTELFDVEALKRLFCNYEISDFIARLQTIGFLNASQDQMDHFLRTIQTLISESALVLKHSGCRVTEQAEVHEGVFCDNCQSSIIGVRYKCAFCFNYDLCSNCEAAGVHEVSHPRVKIAKPVDGVIEQCAWSVQQCIARFNSQVVKTSATDCINVAPGRSFIKTWKIRNPGPRSWPSHCSLSFIDGSSFSAVEDVPIFTSVAADQEIDISVEMKSPSTPGRYQCFWCMKTPEGNYFGEKIWCDINILPHTPKMTPTFISDGQQHLMEYELKTIALAGEERAINAQGTAAPVKEAERESLKALQEMGFTGDLLTIFRKHKGDIADTIHELIVE